MEILYAIIIGIVQGLTEFLPVSSTAHMTIVAKLLGANAISDPKVWTATMATIQLGTLASLLFYFRKEIVSIFVAMAKEPSKFRKEGFSALQSDDRLGWLIVIGSIPIFILGYLLKDFIEGEFTKSFWTISTSLIIVALILWVAEKTGKFTKSIEDVSLLDAFLVGVAQCFALIPGVSRSGATITAGLFLGFKREESSPLLFFF